MNIVGIIPARMGASRFPGKPMAKLHGMPMVGHCFHRTSLANGIDSTYVATCDEEIFDYINNIGGSAIMTSTSHTRATTRTAQAMELIETQTNQKIDIVVMVQGDEPLISPEVISELIKHFDEHSVEIVNIMSVLHTLESFQDPNNVKVVVNKNSDALYFSREAIPSPWKGWEKIPRYMQTGIIAFRRDTLLQFNSMQESTLEQVESIDMNRVIESGNKIRMVLTGITTIGVDTPEELVQAELLMAKDSVMNKYI